jgi:cytochrome c heme-lyase
MVYWLRRGDVKPCQIGSSTSAHMTNAGKCPVQHDPISPSTVSSNLESSGLSTDRETSSIPKSNNENWVYPSEAQFFAAMARKNHHPQAADMKTIVPMHNAVNERAWAEVMRWEAGKGGDACGGIKLVNFKGKPGEISPRARWKTFIGYASIVWYSQNARGSSSG